MAKYYRLGSYSISILHYSLYHWDERELVFLNVFKFFQDKQAHYYSYLKDSKRMNEIWRNRIEKDPEIIYKYGREHDKNFNNLIGYLNRHVQKIRSAEKIEILKIFNNYWELLYLAEPIGDFNHEIDDIYTQRISEPFKKILTRNNKENHYTNYLITLTTPWKVLASQREELEFLKLVQKTKQGKINDAAASLAQHLTKYEWIPVWYDNRPWTIKDLRHRLNAELKAPDIKNRIDKIKTFSSKSKKEATSLIKGLKLKGRLRKDLEALRYFTYIRTKIDLDTSFAVHKARPIYQKIADYLKVSFENLKFLLPEEIRSGLKGNLSRKALDDKIRQRKIFALHIYHKKQGRIIVGQKAKKLYKLIQEDITSQLPTLPKISKAKILVGISASPGKAVGLTRVITSISQLNTMKEGEVLIVPSTSVDFVAAMKKSAAVVTEVGGLTCHAAIISRELGKPCIVNTLVATKIFKTGEMVEVDAEKGTIRRIL